MSRPDPRYTPRMLPTPAGIWIAISFPQSKGDRYPFAVELAQKADSYQAGPPHVAGFRAGREPVQRAVALLEYAGNIRGCMVSTGSSIWGASRALRTLRCYLSALSCPNPATYCRIPYEPADNVYRLGAVPALLPCRMVECYFIKNWHTTGSIQDQLQAAAVESGCEWCPLWKPILEELIAAPAILE